MVDKTNVELAFIEKTDPHLLRSHQFPSKVGGKPAWLSLKPIPDNKDLECENCGKILSFLLQVYSPIEENENTFHRTIFVFICRNVNCYVKNSNKNFRVFRSQLNRNNTFYSPEPPTEEEGPSASFYQDLCVVCGLRGPKRCARCQSVTYCSRSHQEVDWKKSHKGICQKDPKPTLPESKASEDLYVGVLFPEYELVTEPEVLSSKEDSEKSEKERIKEYEDFMKSNAAENVLPDSASKDLEKMAVSDDSQDKIFLKFKERIKDEPDQVLRYKRNGEPLWVSGQHTLNDVDIPNCSCSAQRKFEFQIMPQLLTYMEADSLESSIDWGTLCVYTCSVSCDIGNNYSKEFLWKQDFSETNLPGVMK